MLIQFRPAGAFWAPDRVLADKAYTSAANRAYLRRRGIRATIPIWRTNDQG